MTTYRTKTPNRLWQRTAKALGKWWAGVITLPEPPCHKDAERAWADFPRFPPF
ncbi:MAG: hypothetical protein JO032_06585 [Alphaproteobacteria bacterium]|nr:hypothetical protein [Alphaproteobacteria bacterium]MBV9552444.1 hypothetical protein [Alphaproteobacteria bacterium]